MAGASSPILTSSTFTATPSSKTKPTGPTKAKTDIATGVKDLSIQEPPQIKSKNLDVVAEYKKVKRKNAANFVVIGIKG